MGTLWEYYGKAQGGSNFGIAWAAMEYHYENTLRIIWECCGNTLELWFKDDLTGP